MLKKIEMEVYGKEDIHMVSTNRRFVFTKIPLEWRDLVVLNQIAELYHQ